SRARPRASRRSGPSSITFSRSTRTVRIPRCCTARSRRARPRCDAGVASRRSKRRLGYGVRLIPKPYNHPVRTAESVAVLDLLSDGRVDFGTGRSATRIELEGFGVDPHETREMWREAIEHVVGCWTNDRYSFEGKHWSLPDRRVQPQTLPQAAPAVWGGTTSDDGHAQGREL